VSDVLTIIAVSALILFWGYFFVRGLKRKEFRRKGYWGWFRKEADPIDFWMYIVLCFVELAACVYVLLLILSRK
jgi:hypothetical protein